MELEAQRFELPRRRPPALRWALILGVVMVGVAVAADQVVLAVIAPDQVPVAGRLAVIAAGVGLVVIAVRIFLTHDLVLIVSAEGVTAKDNPWGRERHFAASPNLSFSDHQSRSGFGNRVMHHLCLSHGDRNRVRSLQTWRSPKEELKTLIEDLNRSIAHYELSDVPPELAPSPPPIGYVGLPPPSPQQRRSEFTWSAVDLETGSRERWFEVLVGGDTRQAHVRYGGRLGQAQAITTNRGDYVVHQRASGFRIFGAGDERVGMFTVWPTGRPRIEILGRKFGCRMPPTTLASDRRLHMTDHLGQEVLKVWWDQGSPKSHGPDRSGSGTAEGLGLGSDPWLTVAMGFILLAYLQRAGR
jgi:hypothetical protein